MFSGGACGGTEHAVLRIYQPPGFAISTRAHASSSHGSGVLSRTVFTGSTLPCCENGENTSPWTDTCGAAARTWRSVSRCQGGKKPGPGIAGPSAHPHVVGYVTPARSCGSM